MMLINILDLNLTQLHKVDHEGKTDIHHLNQETWSEIQKNTMPK